MERAFTEYFDAPTLNTTRWQDSSLHGLFHCTKGSAKAKAGADKYCTMALRQNLQACARRNPDAGDSHAS